MADFFPKSEFIDNFHFKLQLSSNLTKSPTNEAKLWNIISVLNYPNKIHDTFTGHDDTVYTQGWWCARAMLFWMNNAQSLMLVKVFKIRIHRKRIGTRQTKCEPVKRFKKTRADEMKRTNNIYWSLSVFMRNTNQLVFSFRYFIFLLKWFCMRKAKQVVGFFRDNAATTASIY